MENSEALSNEKEGKTENQIEEEKIDGKSRITLLEEMSASIASLRPFLLNVGDMENKKPSYAKNFQVYRFHEC